MNFTSFDLSSQLFNLCTLIVVAAFCCKVFHSSTMLHEEVFSFIDHTLSYLYLIPVLTPVSSCLESYSEPLHSYCLPSVTHHFFLLFYLSVVIPFLAQRDLILAIFYYRKYSMILSFGKYVLHLKRHVWNFKRKRTKKYILLKRWNITAYLSSFLSEQKDVWRIQLLVVFFVTP